jgi:hypothetical protein
MDIQEFAAMVRARFFAKAAQLHDYYESRFRVEVVDCLLDAGHKAFGEYPYPQLKDSCDVVVTESGNCEQPTHWIEIKPVWMCSNYRNPSKFFGKSDNSENPEFRRDISKLASRLPARSWFLLIGFSDTDAICFQSVDNPRKRQKMTLPQMALAISRWSMTQMVHVSPFATGDWFCHLAVWDVRGFDPRPIDVVGDTYLVSTLKSGSGGLPTNASADFTA